MTILDAWNSAVAAVRRWARAAARELELALSEHERRESGEIARNRDESVFQTRKH